MNNHTSTRKSKPPRKSSAKANAAATQPIRNNPVSKMMQNQDLHKFLPDDYKLESP